MTESAPTEAQISALVHGFYRRARADALLGPLFEAAVADWEGHLTIVEDFWSHVLLGTGRYRGTPFGPHLRLPIEPEHFDRWLALFDETAAEVLPATAARQALAKATHMTDSFKAGLFPWKRPDGSLSRHKPD